MNISLLVPTRNRPRLLQRLLDSLVETTADLANVEVVLYIDEDDTQSKQFSHRSLSPIKIIASPGRSMGEMNRLCYEASRGRYVMLLNDDVVFRTSGWDTKVLNAFSPFTDDIAMVYGNDLDQGVAVPTFPFISRAVCDVLGEICPRGYQNLHIESHLFDIFKQLVKLGHHRIRYLGDVIFEHMHYILGKADVDQTYIKKQRRADDILFMDLDDERAFKAKHLAEYIRSRARGLKET